MSQNAYSRASVTSSGRNKQPWAEAASAAVLRRKGKRPGPDEIVHLLHFPYTSKHIGHTYMNSYTYLHKHIYIYIYTPFLFLSYAPRVKAHKATGNHG